MHNVPEIAIVDTTNTVQDTVVKVLNNTTTITIKTTIIIIVQIRTNQALEAALKVQALLGEEFLELISICQAPLVVWNYLQLDWFDEFKYENIGICILGIYKAARAIAIDY